MMPLGACRSKRPERRPPGASRGQAKTASASGTALWGAVLLILYSLGLGIPFVLLGLGFSRAQRSLAWLRRNSRWIERSGGLLLVGVGVLFVTGKWQPPFRPLQRWFANWPI